MTKRRAQRPELGPEELRQAADGLLAQRILAGDDPKLAREVHRRVLKEIDAEAQQTAEPRRPASPPSGERS